MHLYQEEEIGLFTFYKQQEELENASNSLASHHERVPFLLHDINRSHNHLRKKGKKIDPQATFTPNPSTQLKKTGLFRKLFGNKLQKEKPQSTNKKLSYRLRKQPSNCQNSQQLKCQLQRLLTNQQISMEDTEQKKMEERSSISLQNPQQIQSNICTLLSSNKRSRLGKSNVYQMNQAFQNITCSSNLPNIPKLDNFPRRIQKKAHSQKFQSYKRRDNLLIFPRCNDTERKRQTLERLRAERYQPRNTYTMKFEYLSQKGQQKGLARLSTRNVSDRLKNKLLLQLAKTIRFS